MRSWGLNSLCELNFHAASLATRKLNTPGLVLVLLILLHGCTAAVAGLLCLRLRSHHRVKSTRVQNFPGTILISLHLLKPLFFVLLYNNRCRPLLPQYAASSFQASSLLGMTLVIKIDIGCICGLLCCATFAHSLDESAQVSNEHFPGCV